MKNASLAIIGVLFVGMIMASDAGAFQIGENRMENGGFESGEVGAIPEQCNLRVTG